MLRQPAQPDGNPERHDDGQRGAGAVDRTQNLAGNPSGAEAEARRRRRPVRRTTADIAPAPTGGPAATSSRVKKTTTPTASLNSDSPAICTSSRFGACAFRSMPRTAIGSVGEIIAPNSRLSRRSTGRPQRRATRSVDPPMMAVGDRDAGGRQHGDQGLFAEERVEVDLQGPCEQQEREHPVEQRLAEMDPRHEPAREVVDRRAAGRRPPPAPAKPRAPRPSRRSSAASRQRRLIP